MEDRYQHRVKSFISHRQYMKARQAQQERREQEAAEIEARFEQAKQEILAMEARGEDIANYLTHKQRGPQQRQVSQTQKERILQAQRETHLLQQRGEQLAKQ